MTTLVVGVDPGMTTGLFAIRYYTDPPKARARCGEPIAVQIHGSEGVVPFVTTLIARDAVEPVLAVEQFVVGPRASRTSSAHAGRVTRALIVELGELAEAHGVALFVRSAAMVKPWTTDKRLEAAGLLDACKEMRHARDAARHALYAAVHMGIAADPLSAKAVAR